jgi:hypothetical protein
MVLYKYCNTHHRDVLNMETTKEDLVKYGPTVTPQVKAETGLATLIETAERVRMNKIEIGKSYSEAFFSAARSFLN